MSTIPIVSCHKCKPELWKAVKGLESEGDYLCKTCHKTINQILRKIRRREKIKI